MTSNNSEEKFWTDDFCSLFREPWRIVPLASYTRDEKLNALTRLSILIALVLLVLGHEYWYIFLGLSLLILILLKYTCNSDGSKIEGFSITPTYASGDLFQTTLAPAFASEWASVPPSYDVYTNVPFEDPSTRYTQDPLLMNGQYNPISWPYGEYTTPLNLMLPNQEAQLRNLCSTGPVTAREFVNNNFTKMAIAHRENLSRIYKQKLNKRFRSNASSGNSFSPFHSF